MAATLAGLLAASGCGRESGAETGAGQPATDPTTDPPADADAALVQQVRGDLIDALGQVEQARRRVPSLRRPLRPLADLHRAHLEALGASGHDDGPEVTERPGLTAVRRRELALQRQLTDAAVRAESGTLAKLLASMAAAVAQHLAVQA
jgi:hypothetical protein